MFFIPSEYQEKLHLTTSELEQILNQFHVEHDLAKSVFDRYYSAEGEYNLDNYVRKLLAEKHMLLFNSPPFRIGIYGYGETVSIMTWNKPGSVLHMIDTDVQTPLYYSTAIESQATVEEVIHGYFHFENFKAINVNSVWNLYKDLARTHGIDIKE